jgi:hypothetical protein
MFLFAVKLLVLVVLLAIASGIVRTWQEGIVADQQLFTKGRVPNPPPQGFYMGSVQGYKVSWQGKSFDAASESGINIFTDGTALYEKYPFKTSVGTGVHDSISVLQIDYDRPENPWWLRPVLDEVVEVAPGKYLGKLNVRVIPGYPFTLQYFELTKPKPAE